MGRELSRSSESICCSANQDISPLVTNLKFHYRIHKISSLVLFWGTGIYAMSQVFNT